MTLTHSGIETLALTAIAPSGTNPRRRFDEEYISDLAESIRQHGILQPVLVRPRPGEGDAGYLLVAGECRIRAAREAGLESVPALIREITDEEALEIQLVENLRRQDLHALEEAEGYQRLIAKGKYDVARIAERVGRSVKYIYDRLKLLALTKKAKELFWQDRITAGHAILLARLRPEDQERALAIDDGDGMIRRAALFQHAGGLPFDEEEFEKAVKKDPYLGVKAVSVREFAQWIQERVKFDRDHVDPVLFPETVEALHAAEGDKLKVVLITREYRASDDVRHAGKERIYGEAAWKRADGKEGSKECDRARVGLVTCGPGQGDAFRVCLDKERCATHWGAWQKGRKKRQNAAGAAGSGARGKERDRWAREEEERRRRHAEEKTEHDRWEKARPEILQALAEKIREASTKPTAELGRLILAACRQNFHKEHLKHEKYLPLGTTAEDLVRHAGFIVLVDELHEWGAPEEFPKRARAFGLDVVALVDRVAPKPVQTVAQPQGKERAKSGKRGKGRKGA